MQTNNGPNLRRWERQPATIPINLVLNAERHGVDNSATVTDFSVGGLGVLTTLALVPGESVKIVAKGEFSQSIFTRVVWVAEAEPGHWNYAGLEFLLSGPN
jgi:hypothetical protein